MVVVIVDLKAVLSIDNDLYEEKLILNVRIRDLLPLSSLLPVLFWLPPGEEVSSNFY